MDINKEVAEVMAYLKEKGNPNTVKIYKNHGATQSELYGVKVGDLKPLQKKYKGNNELAKALYSTQNSDAMYLACLISDPKELDKKTMQEWIDHAWWYMLSEYAVAWVLAETNNALEHILEIMYSKSPAIRSCAWSALSSFVAITPDDELDLDLLKAKLDEVVRTIHEEKNRVKYCMNGYVIALGSYVEPLLEESKKAAQEIGKVEVWMGKTSCKVPFAPDYIQKVEDKGRIGKKRKTAKC